MTPLSMLGTRVRSVFTDSRKWRSSVPFVTAVVFVGITLDYLNSNIVIVVFPFRLEELHYHDVAASVGWLLFLYSAGIVLSTPIVATISERLHSRRGVMIAGQFSLIAAQLLLMMAPTFWVMCIGRFLEGTATCIILTAGLALICDTTPEEDIGGQLGISMIGASVGALVAPPVGGALYDRWGYRAPFIFMILFTVLDITCRLLVVEKLASEKDLGRSAAPDPDQEKGTTPARPDHPSAEPSDDAKESSAVVNEVVNSEPTLSTGQKSTVAEEVTTFGLFMRFVQSPRLLTCFAVLFITTFAFSAGDVAIPLRLQAVWGFDSRKVGLTFLAAIVPTVISNLLAGFLSDRFGARWIAMILTVCGTPWWGAMTTTFSLPFFIVSWAIMTFFVGAIGTPITAELAAITRTMNGVGYAHTYGACNIVFGIASALGSIAAGQIYGHSSRGWDIICYLHIGLLVFGLAGLVATSGTLPFRSPVSDETAQSSDTSTEPGLPSEAVDGPTMKNETDVFM